MSSRRFASAAVGVSCIVLSDPVWPEEPISEAPPLSLKGRRDPMACRSLYSLIRLSPPKRIAPGSLQPIPFAPAVRLPHDNPLGAAAMRLDGKTAVIYGANGGIGATVAQAFAREGAHLFLAGRSLAKVEQVAKAIRAAGGRAEAAEVDALDEQAIDRHLDAVTAKAGRIDIYFNAVGIPNTTLQGTL